MDLNTAIHFAQLVQAAYDVPPADLTNSAGKKKKVDGNDYKVVTTLYASDLATDINPTRGLGLVSIGLIFQETVTGAVVVVIRGTEGILEWIHDVEFLQVPYPFLAGAGLTEDGFTDMYASLRTSVDPGSPRTVLALPSLPYPLPVNSVTVCGHSLGGALATLFALDLAANTIFKAPTVYTYASPRTGNPSFASTYDQVVPNTFRIANRVDIVPKLPFPPEYEHVVELYDLNAVRLLPLPPTLLVKLTIPCEHALDSYLHLLSVVAGGPVLPLDQDCVP